MTKVGIIGCGGRIHGLLHSHWDIAKQQMDVVALTDPNPEAIERYKKDFDCPDASVYDDYLALLQNDEVEWVIIGSINSVHAEQAIAAFAAGKDVFCEKPIAISLEECRALKEAQEKYQRQLMVGFTLRYTPHYNKIKELLSEGAVGDIISLEFNETLDFNHGGYIAGNWRRLNKFGGSHILEKCSHDIDICNWMVDSRVSKVASFGGLDFFKAENAHHIDRVGANTDGKMAYCTWHRDGDINPFTAEKDIIDNQVCILQFENNVRATFHTNIHAAFPERRIYILGTEGALRADLITGKIEVSKIAWDKQITEHEGEFKGGHGGGDELLIKHLCKMMSEGAESLTSLDAGIEAAVACFAMQDAMDQGEVVNLNSYWAQLDLQPV